MKLVEIMTIVALPVSVIALAVVSYQTYLTRKALDLARDSLNAAKKVMDSATKSTELAIRTMQIEMLPSAYWVIQVQIALEQWLKDLESAIEIASVAERQRDSYKLHALARAGLETPKGLVRQFDAEHTPKWLSTIWLAGAQYYYDAKAPQANLWRKADDESWFEFVPDFIIRCKGSIVGIQHLLQMINDVVPAVSCPCVRGNLPSGF